MSRRATTALVLGAALATLAALWGAHIAASGRVAGLFDDEGSYLVAAASLARDGTYRALGTPGAPPELHYPPLFPVMLAGVWRVAPRFPDNLPALKGVPLAAAFGLVLLLPVYLRRVGHSYATALAVGVLTAVAPLTLRYASAAVSELPFTFLAVATLLALERALEPGRPAGAAALCGALAGLALLTRLVGVALVAACAVQLFRHTGWRRALAFVGATGLCLLPWLAWLLQQPADPAGAHYLGELRHGGLPAPHEVARHLAELPAAVVLVALPGLADSVSAHAPAALLGPLYALGLLLLGLALASRHGLYVAGSLALAVSWPLFQARYLLPLAPLFLAPGVAYALTPAVGRVRRGVGLAVLAGAVALAGVGHVRSLERVRATGLPALEHAAADGLPWVEVERVLAWLRDHTAPGDVVGSAHDPLVWLYANRSAVRAYPRLRRPDPDQVSTRLAAARARWILDLPCPRAGDWAAAHDAWEEWLARQAGELTPVYEAAGGRIRVWRLDATAIAPRATAVPVG
jgi:hypothetical protein